MREAMTDLVRQKQMIEEHYAAFWSDAPDETLAAQVTPDFVDHAMPAGTPPGPGPMLAWRKAMRAAFPDMQVTVADAVAEGDRVAVRAIWRGTHQGPFQGLAATGRIVAFEGMVLWRLKNGRLAERWAVIDLAAVLRQLQS
jgi:steroid delta-isomerase-like uncharacterized protein